MTADGAETLTIRDRDMVEAIAALARPGLAARRPPRAGACRCCRSSRSPPSSRSPSPPRGCIPAEAARLVPPARAAELGDRLLILLVERGGAAPAPTPTPCAPSTPSWRGSPPTRRRARGWSRSAPAGRRSCPATASSSTPTSCAPRRPRRSPAGPPSPSSATRWPTCWRPPAPLAALRLLAGGDPGDAALARAADRLAAPPDLGRAGAAVARLAAARIDPAPFAAALPAAPPLPAVDPLPLLDDRQRAALADPCR